MNKAKASILLILPAVLLTGCGGSSSAPIAPVAPPDYGPVGTGLGVIGMGIVIAAAIIAAFGGGKEDK
jgi:hypothetical protein